MGSHTVEDNRHLQEYEETTGSIAYLKKPKEELRISLTEYTATETYPKLHPK